MAEDFSKEEEEIAGVDLEELNRKKTKNYENIKVLFNITTERLFKNIQ